MSCLTHAWAQHEAELRAWARHRMGSAEDVDDLLQDLFLKALRQGEAFCAVKNPRAWLFEVARNALADRLRVHHSTLDLPDDLVVSCDEADAVDQLTACLPRVLSELSEDDREAITLCDLQGMSQAAFARRKGLGLSAAKSRLQRARLRMKEQMSRVCQVRTDPEGHVVDFVPRT